MATVGVDEKQDERIKKESHLMFQWWITMSKSITIPKEEYETLIECKRIVGLDYDRPLSKELLKKLGEAQRDIKSGKGVVLRSKRDIQEYFKTM